MRKTENLTYLLLLLFLFLFGLAFLNSPGGRDLGYWLAWSENLSHLGMVEGMKVNNYDYPPISLFFMKTSYDYALAKGVAPALTLKWFLWFSWVFCAFLVWALTKDLKAVAILTLTTFLSCIGLTFVDIWMIPSLIASLIFLKKASSALEPTKQLRYIQLSSLLYGIAYLTKWHPLALGPIYAIYVWFLVGGNVKQFLKGFVLPQLILFLIFFGIFEWTLVQSFINGVTSRRPYLSGNALNLPWILSYLMARLQPALYGQSIVHGMLKNFHGPDFIWPICKLAFFSAYTFICFRFFKSRHSFTDFLLTLMTCFFAYFTLSSGVHENHLMISVIVAFVLVWHQPNDTFRALFWALTLIFNVNMMLFLGVASPWFTDLFIRAPNIPLNGPPVDVSIPMAAVVSVFFFVVLIFTAKHLSTKGDQTGKVGL